MKRIALTTTACILALTTLGYAAEATKTALAEEIMTLMKVQETMDKSFEAVKQMMPMQMQQMDVDPGNAEEAQKAMAIMMDIMAQEMRWDKIKDEMTALYAEMLTEKELKGLIAFYGSDVGQSFIAKQPEMAARLMQITQGRMMTVMPMIKQKVEEMKAAGN